MSSTEAEAEAEEEGADEKMCCAGCGKAEVDEIKLRKCTDCDLVRYCGIQCQRDHRLQHKGACKKRAAELRDEILFQQPESNHYGDCPICFVPLSLHRINSTLYTCCSKYICIGCNYANMMREIEQRLHPACPFCRHPLPKSQKEAEKNLMKRIEVNDPEAMCHMGTTRHKEGDFDGAFEYWTKAAKLGDADAHYNLSVMYCEGGGVEKDEKKDVYHLEEAAIGGHPEARYNLGVSEWNSGRHERAVKHCIIAANLGYDDSLKRVKEGYAAGIVSKDDFAAALRGHQAAVDATKSPQRETAEAFMRRAIKST